MEKLRKPQSKTLLYYYKKRLKKDDNYHGFKFMIKKMLSKESGLYYVQNLSWDDKKEILNELVDNIIEIEFDCLNLATDDYNEYLLKKNHLSESPRRD